MILTNINAINIYPKFPDAIVRAINYLKENKDNILGMEPGDYEIEGKAMFAKVFDVVTQQVENTKPEIHKEYIDIQYWASGNELMGYAPNYDNNIIVDSQIQNDLYFLKDVQQEIFIPASTGDIMVLFPEDIHRPAIRKDNAVTCRKVVIKVSVTLV